MTTTAQQAEPAVLPEKIARQLVLPEGHADLSALFDAYKWMRNNMPVAKAGDEFTKQLLGGSLRILDALPYIDPPEHTAAKNMAFNYFKPPSVKKLEDQMRQLAGESIDHLKKLSARGEIDLVDDWALGFPLHVIMTLLGVPPEDEP